MMYEEAIYILKNAAWLGSNENRVAMEMAVALAVNALEKQIPVKPDTMPDEYGTTISYYCPSCCAYFGKRGTHSTAIFNKPYYCKCGQHIDWSE